MEPSTCPTCSGALDATTGVCPRCATTVRPITPSRDAHPQFPGYRVISQIGEGGMGAVYLAEDTTLGRRVAIKVVSQRLAADAQSRSRFMREARTLATIEHPHVVRVYSFGESEGNAYLVMEYVEGETLADRITRVGKLPVDEALRITRQIVDALEAAWERRIIHRDIKPSNILIDRRNEVRVADFGLAKPIHLEPIDSSLTQNGYMLGTPHYVSPEQAQGKDVDFRTDIYSCGIMLYQMLTGERPFEGTTPVAIVAQHLHSPVPPVRPANVDHLIQWMTEKEPEKRPASLVKLLDAIDERRAGTPAGPGRLRVGRTWLIAVPIVIAALILIAVLGGRRPSVAPSSAPNETRLVVAVTPFYGPDDDSAKEGRVMAALIERAIEQRLGRENARVIGIDETKSPVRDHEAARALGEKLHANAVIWGEAFALRKETEIQPHVTILRVTQQAAAPASASSPDQRLLSESVDPLSRIEARGGGPLKLEAEAPNQIELRKTSASGIGDVVLTLAGIHALETQQAPQKALAFFAQAPRSAETLRYQAKALLQLNRKDEARVALEQSLTLDPNDAQTFATLGDLHLTANRFADAVTSYNKAEAAGQLYTSSRAFMDHGRLYLKETYRSKEYTGGEEFETVYLLGVDPATQRILARYPLPGLATRFSRNGDAVTLTYKSHKDDSPEEAQIIFRNGAFDRPLWPPPNLLWRMRSMRGGRVLAANFVSQFGTRSLSDRSIPHFVPSSKLNSDAPTTFPELEHALRSAADRDPTQPWHLFLLALSLQEQQREAEARQTMQEMLRRDYAGIPYYEFAGMMTFLERMRLYAWEDAIYAKALAQQRRLPQIIGGSTLIERLINAGFSRQAAINHDPSHGRRSLDEAQALTGFVLEGDDLGAAAWAKYFHDQGDERRAAREEAVVRYLRRQPLNFLGAQLETDYALVCTVAATVAFLILFGTTISKAAARLRPTDSDPITLYERVRDSVGRLPHVAVIVTFAAGIVGIAYAIAYLWVNDLWAKEYGFATLLAVLAVMMLRMVRLRPVSIIAAIPPRERVCLAIAYGVLIIFGVITLLGIRHLGLVASIPIGFNDSIGQEHIIQDLENRLARNPGRRELIYATAVANHYGGHRQRAETLYAAAGKNATLLARDQLPSVKLTLEEMGAAYTAAPWRLPSLSTLQALGVTPLIGLIFVVFFAAVPVLLVAFVKPYEMAMEAPQPRSIISTALMLLIPGLYDLRRGGTWLGYAAAWSFAFIILPIYTWQKYGNFIPAASPFGTADVANLLFVIPFPPNVSILAIRVAPPFAHLFWSAFVVAVIVTIVVHARAIVKIVRR